MTQDIVIDLDTMRDGAPEACALMKVLSNPDRLLLLCGLAEGECNVGELAHALGIVQPTLSQQLAVLRTEGLVNTRRDGKNIYYQIASTQALALMQWLYTQFGTPSKPKRTRR